MKKIVIALLLVAMLVTLAACNQVEITKAIPRWGNEHFTYKIRRADLSESKVSHGDEAYWVEPLATNYDLNPTALDQYVPEDIGGTYVVDIALAGGERQCVCETEQHLYAQYETSLLQQLGVLANADFQKLVVTDETTITAAGLEAKANMTVLHSYTKTSVTFEYNSYQRPLESTYIVDGFYLGKTWQGISKQTIETVYHWDNNKVSATINGENHNIGNVTLGKFIDSNQLLLYVRSLEKGSNKFQDKPSFQIFTAATKSTSSASTLFNYKCNTVIHNGDDLTCVKLNAVAVIIDSVSALYQLNLPDTVNANANLDKISDGKDYLDKFTTVRFRSGFVAYELAEYSADIVNALVAATQPAE